MTSAYDSDPIFETHPKQLSNLIGRINNKEIALPDFQRNFVWEPQAVIELIRSIVSRYPVGTLLFWRQPKSGAAFQHRSFAGAPTTDHPDELVLDGQQRLTSLYLALTGKGSERYFLRLARFLDDDATKTLELTEIDFEKAIFSRPSSAKADADEDLRESIFPISHTNSFPQWLDDYVETRYPDSPDRRKTVKALLWNVHDRFIVPLKSYGFPVVILPETTSLDAVCTIFETLNRTGQRLGVFELLTARFFPYGVNLRKLWSDALESYPVLKEFGVNPYGVLQSVSLKATEKSAQRADVLKLSAELISKHWSSALKGYVDALTLLQDECGVASPRWLPYSMILVPLSAAWSTIDSLKPIERIAARSSVTQYFWCSVFTGNFDQGANSQAGADYQRLKVWLKDPSNATAPEAVTDFGLNASSLRFANTRRKALYFGLLCLTVSAKAQDFHTGQAMSPARVKAIQIESHHIFPKAYLRDQKWPSSPESVLNRVLIDKDTNRIIRSRPPGEYVDEMKSTFGVEKLQGVLDSHLIDFSEESPLLRNDYEGFLDERLQSVIDLIEIATSKKVTRDYPKDAEGNVLAAPGQQLESEWSMDDLDSLEDT